MSIRRVQSKLALRQRRWSRPKVATLLGAIVLLAVGWIVLPWLMWAAHIDRAAKLIEQGTSWPANRVSDTLPAVSDPQRLENALDALDKAQAWRPDDAHAYRLRGQIALAAGRWEEAETAFAEAGRRAPTNPLIAWEQALAYEQRHGSAWMPTGSGTEPESNQELRLLWQSAGLDMQQFVNRGEEERAVQRFAEALRWYERASIFAPQAGIPWYYAALVYETSEQNDLALKNYRQAVELQPDLRDAWYKLGKLHMARKEWPNALAALSQAVQAQSGDISLAEIYYSIGQVRQYFLTPPDIAGAEQAYDQALAAQPPGPDWLRADLRYQRATILGRQQRWSEAVAEYQQSLALRPDFAPAHNGLAITLWRLGDISAARLEGLRTIELAPDSIDGYRTLAHIYESEGDRAQAYDFYNHMLRLQPDNKEAQAALDRLK